MTTIDHARLRALAEAAQEVESVGAEWHSVEGFHEDCGLDIRDAEYLAAIDPPTLIALLDRLEAATAYVADPGNWSAMDGRREYLWAVLNGEAPR